LGFLGINVVLAESEYYDICEVFPGAVILALPRSDGTSKQETLLDLTTSQATMTHSPAESGVFLIEVVICHNTPPSPN